MIKKKKLANSSWVWHHPLIIFISDVIGPKLWSQFHEVINWGHMYVMFAETFCMEVLLIHVLTKRFPLSIVSQLFAHTFFVYLRSSGRNKAHCCHVSAAYSFNLLNVLIALLIQQLQREREREKQLQKWPNYIKDSFCKHKHSASLVSQLYTQTDTDAFLASSPH